MSHFDFSDKAERIKNGDLKLSVDSKHKVKAEEFIRSLVGGNFYVKKSFTGRFLVFSTKATPVWHATTKDIKELAKITKERDKEEAKVEYQKTLEKLEELENILKN